MVPLSLPSSTNFLVLLTYSTSAPAPRPPRCLTTSATKGRMITIRATFITPLSTLSPALEADAVAVSRVSGRLRDSNLHRSLEGLNTVILWMFGGLEYYSLGVLKDETGSSNACLEGSDLILVKFRKLGRRHSTGVGSVEI